MRQEVQQLKIEIGVMSQIIKITAPVYEKSDLITDQDYENWEEYCHLKNLSDSCHQYYSLCHHYTYQCDGGIDGFL